MGFSSKQVSTDAQEWAEQSFLQATPAKQLNQPKEPPLKCPRCESMNTKFCYYNNYNRSQPRYYCKSCKRHWTNGGNLRNVPVGGARRNKRRKTAKQSEEEAELLNSNVPLPFFVPSFSLTTPENLNTPSSSSTYISGAFQSSDDIYCSGVVASEPLPSSTRMMESLSDWSWDEFNTLLSASVRQPWEDFEIEEQGNLIPTQ